jgi:hypothetical protein
MSFLTLNPFRPTRWEHHADGRPLIWFTGEAEQIAEDKSVYVFGPRGTGKTTLLRGICWEDLCYNESLRVQRRIGDFNSIGIYIRFPDHIASSMAYRDWASIFPGVIDPDLEFHNFFSAAIEGICIERIADAFHRLREIDEIVLSAARETTLVADFLSEYPALNSFSAHPPLTLLDLARCLRTMIVSMNRACGRGTVADIVQLMPLREPNQMLAYFAERATAAIKLRAPNGLRTAGLKFCLDDCEVLSPIQRKSLNSLVRASRAPCSWVVSAVGSGWDYSETFQEAQPLTDADRRVVALENRNEADFRNLCQSVVSLRLLFALPENERPTVPQEALSDFFDLDRKLGRRDVNDMMSFLVRRSARKTAKILKMGAERLYRLLANKQKQDSISLSTDAERLPYYEAYILMMWQHKEDSFKTSISESDIDTLSHYIMRFDEPGFEAWLRRKQRGALMHFAASLGVRRIPLAGANIVVSLADGSVRDFLEIMGEIYEAHSAAQGWNAGDIASLHKFALSRTQVAGNVQTDGIYAASKSYYDGVSRRVEIDTDIVSRLISGLGEYTSVLQANSNDPRTLSTAERGVFFLDFRSVMNIGSFKEHADFVHGAIRQAELAGYIRVVEHRRSTQQDDVQQFRSIAFRLHRRFAPHFKFSYRGAYEPVPLAPSDLWALCVGQPRISTRDWAETLAGRSMPTQGQLEFPSIGEYPA